MLPCLALLPYLRRWTHLCRGPVRFNAPSGAPDRTRPRSARGSAESGDGKWLAGLTMASLQGTAPLGMALLLHATTAVVLPQTWTRRSFVGSACAAAALPASAQASTMDLREALAVASPAQEAIFKRLPNPPRPPTPPAALLLRAEEVCHEQEALLRSASAADEKLILARPQTSLFVRILIRNTNLEQISGAQGAVSFIRGVASIAEAGLGPLTSEELLAMAKQYRAAEVRAEAPLVAGRGASWVHRGTARRPHSHLEHSTRGGAASPPHTPRPDTQPAARFQQPACSLTRPQDELRVAFETLPPDKQEKGRAVARELRLEDDERRAAAAREAQEAARQEAERIGRLYAPT